MKFIENIENKEVSLIKRQSHGPEVTDGGLVNHLLGRRTLQALHRLPDNLLRLHQVFHLGGEEEQKTTAVAEPAGGGESRLWLERSDS